MSFENTSEEEKIETNVDLAASDNNDASAFENYIMQCCKAPEWELRKFLRKTLTRAGFSIFEDGYKTDRVSRDKRYETVHNMLAIRGNPKVCLVSHTDVCRDHNMGYNREAYYWMNGRHMEEVEGEKVSSIPKVEPVIKEVMHDGVLHRIIQDKYCKTQVGGDDRLGVAINSWIALNTGYDIGLYFPTDEEIGLKSAAACEMEQLKEFDLCVEVDRGNHSNQLVIKIGNEILCCYDTAVRLLEIAYDMGMPREVITGASTDVVALKRRGWIKEAVNMTCGYKKSFGASPEEYIDILEARNTMQFVSNIVKDYYLRS